MNKSIVSKSLLSLAVLVVFFAIVEVIVHFIPPLDRFVTYRDANVLNRNIGPHKEYHYKGGSVGKIGDFKVRIKHNSLGFHDREYSTDKKKGVYRIVVIGDSQVESKQVPLEDTFHKIVEQRFISEGRNVEVIALGKGGRGLKNSYELYKKIGRRLKPDMVIWGFMPINDIYDSLPRLKEKIIKRNMSSIKIPPNFLRFSAITTFLYTRKFSSNSRSNNKKSAYFDGEFSNINKLKNWNFIVFLDNWSPLYEEAWEQFKKDFNTFSDSVIKDNTRMVVISIAAHTPYWLERKYKDTGLKWNFDKPDKLLKQLVESKSIIFISSRQTFDSHQNIYNRRLIFRTDGHLNQQGHGILADYLYKKLKEIL